MKSTHAVYLMYEEAHRAWVAAGRPVPEELAQYNPVMRQAGKMAAMKMAKTIDAILNRPRS